MSYETGFWCAVLIFLAYVVASHLKKWICHVPVNCLSGSRTTISVNFEGEAACAAVVEIFDVKGRRLTYEFESDNKESVRNNVKQFVQVQPLGPKAEIVTTFYGFDSEAE